MGIKRSRCLYILFALTVVIIFNHSIFSESFWKKPIYFLSVNSKIDSAIIWDMHLGTYSVNLVREYPYGKKNELKNVIVDVMINIYGKLISFGYGRGWNVESKPDFEVDFGKGIKKVEIDSIEYIFCNGSMVKLRDGNIGELFINIEGNRVKIKEIILERYILEDEKRKESLKSYGFFYPSFLSFTKAGLKDAQKITKECVSGNKK